MPRMLRTLLLAAGALSACGPQPLTTDPSGGLQVSAVCTPAKLAETLQRRPEATLVVALDVGDADVLGAVAAAGRAQAPFVVSVGRYDPDDALPDALVAEETGADVAVDLALLACGGVPLNGARYEVGTRTWTPANRAAGGAPTLAPADPILAMLRQQHAALLNGQPATEELHRVAFVTPGGAAWQRAALAAAQDAAGRRPRVRIEPFADVAAAVAAAPGAIILATHDADRTAAAAAAEVPVLVLDPLLGDAHATCRIGCSPATLARAAAGQVQALLPDGGSLVLCTRGGDEATTAMRLNAFAAALELDPAALR